MRDSRYRAIHPLGSRSNRRIALGLDRWTGSSVVLKTDAATAIQHEARCLLELPCGLAPAILDVIQADPDQLTLILERLEGRSLRDAMRELSVQQLPVILLALCRCLAHLHRAGWIHADLKPENIFLLNGTGAPEVRLLDFGYSIGRFTPSGVEGVRGGTPPYLAPEIRKGWVVDDRADLYSLGVVLRDLLECTGGDARWSPILSRLLEEIPARRYADASEAAASVLQSFDITKPARDHPRWAAGPLHGREAILEGVVEFLSTRRMNVLVQARPGAGLTRFMLEASLRAAARGGSPIRIVDLPALRTSNGASPALDCLETELGAREVVLCGMDDPSPGLRWSDNRQGDLLRRLAGSPAWERVALPVLDLESTREIVAIGLGSLGAQAETLAETLFEAAEGDLRLAAQGFVHCTQAASWEGANGWQLETDAFEEARASWHPCVRSRSAS